MKRPVINKLPIKDIMAVRDEVHKLQDEAAKNPHHWINDGLKQHFEEERQKLKKIKSQPK